MCLLFDMYAEVLFSEAHVPDKVYNDQSSAIIPGMSTITLHIALLKLYNTH